MHRLLAVLCFTTLAFAAGEQDVRAALDQFNQAARTADNAALEKLLSPDLVYVHSNAKVENKAECIAALVSQKPNFVLAPGIKVKIYGNTAVVHGKMTANVVQNGTPTKIELDLLQVWVRNGSQWQMVARHTARLPA
ncbi:MAG: nuclear transport factor 2 family protein [Acidimicrobiia bacterium]|nr:nuclear transport factor 2 family protein [Acidimicrobiia bacterium]